MMALLTCQSCARHVKHGAGRCPFCGTTVTSLASVRAPARKRLTRAAWIAGATGVAGAITACSLGHSETVYGAPPFDAGFADAGRDSRPIAVDASYGGSRFDASWPEDASDAGDPNDSGKD